ncbi:hypothetical protein [Phenylobacterium sp.]|jgi:SAM-dependent methyltransferase|uniref:hypothetical protein n=1 Tax=Phenylobacterium sp. TaxID=1871053 RepID=UPI002F929CEE
MQTMTVRDFLDWFNQPLGYRAVSHYAKNTKSLLASLCDKYGSDKGEVSPHGHPYRWPSHTYTDVYGRLYDHCRHYVRTVFECGIGTNNISLPSHMGARGRPGASLRAWRDYFPNAQIIGADVDADILFEEERIRTYHVDQTDPASIARLWAQLPDQTFDLMLDDGLHTFEAGLCLFENSFHKVAPEGVYIIEDIKPDALVKFRDYFQGKDLNIEI